MADWTLCHTPDFGNKGSGLFLSNPGSNHNNRFWHLRSNGNTQSPSNPPVLHQQANTTPDQVWFGIEIDPPPGSGRYTVTGITVDSSAKSRHAGQASPFRDPTGTNLVCMISGPLGPVLTVTTPSGASRFYQTIGPIQLFQDPTQPAGISEYELTVVATVQDAVTGISYQFSNDPEMDVDNTP
jgi:hypothetical protein